MTLPNTQTTRFSGGLTNEAESSLFANMGQPNPLRYLSYLNDFTAYVAADYVVTATGAATEALAAGDGGLLLITNSAGNNDIVEVQKTPAMFSFVAGKSAWFKTRFKVSDATKSRVIMGLQIVNTDPTAATDGIYFNKSLASTALDIIVRKDATTGSNTVAHIADLADDTFVTMGWYYDAEAQLVYYSVNDVVLGSLDASATYLPDATNLAPVMFLKNGEAVAKTMTVDYLYLVKRR